MALIATSNSRRVCFLFGILHGVTAFNAASLQSDIQVLLDAVASQTGYGISLGFVGKGELDFGLVSGPRTMAGLPPKSKPGNLTTNDTYVLGSGTKMFTSTCMMRLVDEGKVKLEDKAASHLDGAMKRMWNTTMEELFGARAAKVTIGHLIRMQSGLGDFDVPKYDEPVLRSTGLHNPLSDLQFVANYSGPFGCQTGGCTWVCEPGACTSYSSTNYLLAAIVLAAHAPENQTTWQSYDQYSCLFQGDEYKHTQFPTYGPLPSKGLTTAGKCLTSNGTVEVYAQDASIMGFGYGNAVASPLDVARFLFDLLGPPHRFVSNASLSAMQKWSPLSTGWAKGAMVYGAGLEVRSVAAQHESPPKTTDLASFIGHDGVTFGFFSNQGWFPQLDSAIALMTNQEHDDHINYAITCHIVKIVAEHKKIPTGDQPCPVLPTVKAADAEVFV